MSIEDLMLIIESYNQSEGDKIRKAYEYAKELHKGQYRQSGEEYITHPLNVAYILALMHADSDTVCAGLLHDTLEDTNTTKEEIATLFNKDIANLVDGVTKLAKMNFSSKEEQNLANTRKIITSITTDVRIIIIKLADRLHNMRTLQYKNTFKQKENALETMEIFAPLAYYIGAYQIKNELEDLSLKYLKPDMYELINEKRQSIEIDTNDYLLEMLYKIEDMLNDKKIHNSIKIRIKNIYGIYKQLNAGNKLSDIHDLLALKIMVDEIEDCYLTLYYVHMNYKPINDKFRDYICNPKTNMYSSLHTTVFGPDNRLVQAQIRTFKMNNIDTYGLATYWDTNGNNARNIMQNEVKNKYQFFKSLTEIDDMFSDNSEFVNRVKSELFADRVYVYNSNGEVIELPKGSTPIDFAYKLHSDKANSMIGVVVNDEYVPIAYELKNNDRVRIITDELSDGPREEWIGIAKTSHAKKKIMEFNNKN